MLVLVILVIYSIPRCLHTHFQVISTSTILHSLSIRYPDLLSIIPFNVLHHGYRVDEGSVLLFLYGVDQPAPPTTTPIPIHFHLHIPWNSNEGGDREDNPLASMGKVCYLFLTNYFKPLYQRTRLLSKNQTIVIGSDCTTDKLTLCRLRKSPTNVRWENHTTIAPSYSSCS